MNSIENNAGEEAKFIEQLRKSVSPESDRPREKVDFLDIFASNEDQQLTGQIANRSIEEYRKLSSCFVDNADALHLQVHMAHSLKDAAVIIAEIADTQNPEYGTTKHLIQHVHPDIQELQLWQQFSDQSVTVHTSFAEDPEVMEKTRASYIGVTVADWGIADSASIVQLTHTGRPRSTSLVPSIHVALLRQTRLLASLEEAYAMLGQETTLDSFIFITGPSKTADIEAHMVHGAHGPRQMHCIIIKDEDLPDKGPTDGQQDSTDTMQENP